MLAIAGSSCHKEATLDNARGNVLVEAGDSVLYLEDVERLIPSGLLPEDSIEMFRQITDHWVESVLLEDLAKENVVDLERIDRLTEIYRNRLIVQEYIRKMGSNAPSDVRKEDVEAYYRQYGDSMRLTQPLIKGIYLRTSEKDPQLDNIRAWITSANEEDIDRLEKKGLREALGYEYFLDRWVEWGDVATQLPVRVEDADLFLAENTDFETARAGTVHLLHIAGYVPSGSKMPKEYALKRISDILADRRAGEYRKRLKQSIYRKAAKEGKLKKGLYDPFERFK